MGLTTGSAVLNVGLNIILVPRFGIVGAAAATLTAYLAICIVSAILGNRFLRVRMPWATFLRAAVASLAMYYTLTFLEFDHKLITLAVRSVVGALVYLVVIVALDAQARSMTLKALVGLRRRLADRRAKHDARGGGADD
jgi:O-antigen/teichoic acid export membrane protein